MGLAVHVASPKQSRSDHTRISTLSVYLARLKFEFREIAGLFPFISLPVWRHLARTKRVTASKHTKLILEGFPRSANSFSSIAFDIAQGHPQITAHHLHSPAQVVFGVRNRIPTLVLIRKPDDAVIAAKLVMPFLTLTQILRAYNRFYQHIRPYRQSIVVATFEEVVSDFGAVIDRLNVFYGTQFARFEHSQGNQQACFDLIDRQNPDGLAGATSEFSLARPSPAKDLEKERFRVMLGLEEFAAPMRQARAMYRAILAGHQGNNA